MNQLLNSFLNLFKNWDRGELPLYPDPPSPSDLGTPLTQSEIDFVKKLKKEMEERFPAVSTCTEEKPGASITNPYYLSFTVGWSNPALYAGTIVTYRVQGSSTWLTPNLPGNATGEFNGSGDAYIFDSGFSVGETYQVRVQNICPDSIESAGTILSATATNSAP